MVGERPERSAHLGRQTTARDTVLLYGWGRVGTCDQL